MLDKIIDFILCNIAICGIWVIFEHIEFGYARPSITDTIFCLLISYLLVR